jgi:gliding motility-associated-like protein
MGLVNVQYQAVNRMFFNTYLSVFRSADQGTTLDALFSEPNTNGQLNGFTMNGQRAWAIGYRFSPEVQRTMIFRTLNAYATTPVWDTVKTFPTGSLAPQPRNIKFANQDTGYVTGTRGKVYRTINGGNTWTDVSPDTTVNGNGTATYTALSLVNGKTIFVGGSSRKLFKSTDAGATWTDLTLVVPTTASPITSFTSINNIIMNDENNGYLHSGGIVLKTNNAWASWSFDVGPGGFSNISLYPKMAGPLDNKKLYGMPLSAGSPVNSTNTAFLIEYGTADLTTVSTSESIEASCDNTPTGKITINATGGIAPYSFSLNGGPFQASNVFTNLSQGNKTITIKDAGCAQLTKTISVGVKPGPAISAGSDFTIVNGDEVMLTGLAGGTNPTIVWTPGTGLTGANTLNPMAKPAATTVYTLTVTDANGCSATDNTMVTVIPYCIKVMDAFTPNGDGMNDRWLVTNGASCTKQIAVNVYNRYGGLVYKNDNYQNDWTGTYNGKPVADGTYYYTAVFTTITNNRVILKGDLTILR